MLKIKTIPVLTRIISKLDLKPVIEIFKNADIFKEAKGKKDALKQLSGEKATELGFAMLAEITPQLGAVGEDLPEFVALYYGISIEEAAEKDFAEVLNDLIHDEGIRGFFATALRKKVEREA